jgi:hypothetical protein
MAYAWAQPSLAAEPFDPYPEGGFIAGILAGIGTGDAPGRG